VPAWRGVLSLLARFWVKIGRCKYHLTLKLWFLGAAASGAPKLSLSKSKVSWTGMTGHNEVVRLVYDPQIISTRVLLEIFFVIHDPTTLNRQGNDRGTQYRSGIYFTKPEQAEVAKSIMAEIEAEHIFESPLVTEVLHLDNYSAAEDYHQDFFERNPTQGYCLAVAAPKVWKFKKTFSEWMKSA